MLRDEKVDFRTLIRVPPVRAFTAFATARGLDEWFTTGAELDERPGGLILFRWKDWGLDKYSGEIPGDVVEYDAPRRFVFHWRADSGTYFTTVEVDFIEAADGTIVHLIEYGYHDTPEGMVDLLNRVSGWAQVLTLMKFHLEYGAKY